MAAATTAVTTVSDPVNERWEMLRRLGGRPAPQGQRPAQERATGASGRTGSSAAVPRAGRPTRRETRYDGRPDRSFREPDSFSDLVRREIRRNGWSRNFAVGTLRDHWPTIVGEDVSRHAHVVMYKEKERQLHIECDSTAWATNLRLMQSVILQTIAKKVGPDVVAELRIYGPRAPSWRAGRLHVKGRGPRDTYG
jgi:predicted nucleic acid-binding Zn ribbon protein